MCVRVRVRVCVCVCVCACENTYFSTKSITNMAQESKDNCLLFQEKEFETNPGNWPGHLVHEYDNKCTVD